MTIVILLIIKSSQLTCEFRVLTGVQTMKVLVDTLFVKKRVMSSFGHFSRDWTLGPFWKYISAPPQDVWPLVTLWPLEKCTSAPQKKKKHFGPYYFGPFSSTYKNCHVYDCFIRNILYIIIDSMDAQYQNKMHPHANVTTV